MKFQILIATLAVAFSLVQADAQELKIATVDMKRLVNDYYRTVEVQSELSEKQALLTKSNNEKQKQIQEIEEELSTLRKQFEDPSLNDNKRKELHQQLQLKQQEGIAMSRSLKEYLDRKRRQVQEGTQRKMRSILEEITAILEETAKTEDFDYVFDKSGNSTTQVPVLLYAKDAADITEVLLKKLNENAPKK